MQTPNDNPTGITSASQVLPPSPSESRERGVREEKGAVYSSIGGIIPTPTATTATATTATATTTSNDVNLLTAYLLYSLFGIFGIHHAYLHRPNQGLAWYASGGLFGWGLLRDLFCIPGYVSLARDNGRTEDCSNNVTARIRDATVQARNGIPKMSLARIILMGAFGTYFGFIASCLVYLPVGRSTGALYGTLRAIGAAAGIWLVGNMGDQMIMASPGNGGGGVGKEFTHLVAWCIGGFAVLNAPVIGGITYAVRRRRYRPSMSSPRSSTDKGSPSSSAARARIGRHLLTCAIFTALLVLAAYNHGSVTVNGDRKVYLREAMRNAYRSKFWEEEFDWAQFRGRGGDGGEYLKKAFDLQGERAARRTLGVRRDAPHSEVRSAYKKLALKYHPDKMGLNLSDKEVLEAQGQFVKVQEAYEVLNDIEQRRKKHEAGASREGGHSGGNRPERDEM